MLRSQPSTADTAGSGLSTNEVVTMAVKALQECASIVPSSIKDDDFTDDEDDDVQSAAPNFVKKLKDLIDDPEIDSAQWTPDHVSFIVREPKRLSVQLAKYFKSSKLKSFVRQLHFYGFKKIGGSRYADWVYNHKFFQQHGRLLHKLRRKTCGPDQQIKNLQMKVDSLQGTLVETQHKLGDMAVALMALLQQHNAATFLGSSKTHNHSNTPLLPAKRVRSNHYAGASDGGGGGNHGATSTSVVAFNNNAQPVLRQQRLSGAMSTSSTSVVKQEPARPEKLESFQTTMENLNNMNNAFLGAPLTPGAMLDFDFAEMDDLFSPGRDEYGQSIMTDANMVPVTA